MTAATQILIACLAFAGATFAQIMSHWLTLFRRRAEQKEETLLFFQAFKSDVDYACLQILRALSLFDDIMEERATYQFTFDRIYLRMDSLVMDKYDPKILVHPGLIHRTRAFYFQVRDIFDALRELATPEITAEGRRNLIDLLRYGLSLSVRFEKITQGGDIDDYQTVSDDMLLDHLYRARFAGPGNVLTRADLARLFSEDR